MGSVSLHRDPDSERRLIEVISLSIYLSIYLYLSFSLALFLSLSLSLSLSRSVHESTHAVFAPTNVVYILEIIQVV
jgi:hypothetical protein